MRALALPGARTHDVGLLPSCRPWDLPHPSSLLDGPMAVAWLAACRAARVPSTMMAGMHGGGVAVSQHQFAPPCAVVRARPAGPLPTLFCFPASATVHAEGRGTVAMEHLRHAQGGMIAFWGRKLAGRRLQLA